MAERAAPLGGAKGSGPRRRKGIERVAMGEQKAAGTHANGFCWREVRAITLRAKAGMHEARSSPSILILKISSVIHRLQQP